MVIIKRNILDELIAHLTQREISLIIGPRQAGKTTIMRLLMEYLKKEGKESLFLNLDNDSESRFFSSQETLIRKIKLELGKESGFIFIDEIQRKNDAGLFLKGIYDRNLPYKFIVSGSGSIELKEKIHESLTGRKRIFELSTISFEEFINYKTEYRYQDKLESFLSLEEEKVDSLLEDFMNFGGYPRLVLEDKIEEKRKIIDEIFRSYIEKDIMYLLKSEKIESFSMLVKILASQIGQLVNYSEQAATVGLSLPTIKNYLGYCEKTFIIDRVTPFYKNIRKEITRAPVVYFYDIGLRNYSIGVFGNLFNPNDKGFVFQNIIYNILKEKLRWTGWNIHFWRTTDKAEVDFIITDGTIQIPVEVKNKKLAKPVLGRSLYSFIDKYNPSNCLIVNLRLDKEEQVKNTTIRFVPFLKLLGKEFPDRYLYD